MGKKSRRRSATAMSAATRAGPKTSAATASPATPAADANGPRAGVQHRRLGWLVLVMLVLAALSAILWYRGRSLQLAEQALRAGDVGTASTELAIYLDKHPDDPRALALLGQVHLAQGETAKAIQLFERAGGPEDLPAWAQAYLIQEEWSKALPLLESMVELDPANPEAWYQLTGCQMWLGHLQDALQSAEQYRKSAQGREGEAQAWMLVASIHEEQRDYENAVQAYRQTLAHAPDALSLQIGPQDFYYKYARALFEIGQLEEAYGMARRSLAARPLPDAATLAGNILAQKERPVEASQSWQLAIQLDHHHVGAREALAQAALDQGKNEEAQRWLEPLTANQDALTSSAAELLACAFQADDTRAAVWRQRAAELREAERVTDAVENILSSEPQSFWARVIRAHRFAGHGNWRQAELMVEQLRREAPEETFVARLAQALETNGTLPPLAELPVVRTRDDSPAAHDREPGSA